jgi:hypothetical protein
MHVRNFVPHEILNLRTCSILCRTKLEICARAQFCAAQSTKFRARTILARPKKARAKALPSINGGADQLFLAPGYVQSLQQTGLGKHHQMTTGISEFRGWRYRAFLASKLLYQRWGVVNPGV